MRNVSATDNILKNNVDKIETTRSANINFDTLNTNTYSSRKDLNDDNKFMIKSGEGFPTHQPSYAKLNPISSIEESQFKKVKIKNDKPRVKSANQYVGKRNARTLVSRGGRNDSMVSN